MIYFECNLGIGKYLLDRRTNTFQNINCSVNSTCDLKNIEYLVENYRVEIDAGFHYGTRFIAKYTTNSVKNLKKYVFVQAIKGCVFDSQIVSNKRKIYFNYCQLNDDSTKCKLMSYPEFNLKSSEDDPLYNAMPVYARHYFYRWLTEGNDFFDYSKHTYFGRQKPRKPSLFIVDHPGTAFKIDMERAKNIALEFRTCLYKTRDVPLSLDPAKIDFAEPIHCFSWESSWIYSHNLNIYEQPDTGPVIQEICKLTP